MPLFETSAKDDDKAYHVEAIFVTLAHKIKKRKSMLCKNGASKEKTTAIVYNVKDVGEDGHSSTCLWC